MRLIYDVYLMLILCQRIFKTCLVSKPLCLCVALGERFGGRLASWRGGVPLAGKVTSAGLELPAGPGREVSRASLTVGASSTQTERLLCLTGLPRDAGASGGRGWGARGQGGAQAGWSVWLALAHVGVWLGSVCRCVLHEMNRIITDPASDVGYGLVCAWNCSLKGPGGCGDPFWPPENGASSRCSRPHLRRGTCRRMDDVRRQKLPRTGQREPVTLTWIRPRLLLLPGVGAQGGSRPRRDSLQRIGPTWQMRRLRLREFESPGHALRALSCGGSTF